LLEIPPSEPATTVQEAGASSAPAQPDAERDLDDAQLNSSDFDVDTDWEEDDEDPDSVPGTPAKLRASQAGESSSGRPATPGSELPSGLNTPAIPEGELTGDVDWAALDAEVDAAMNEDDEDDDEENRSEVGSEQGEIDVDDDTISALR
jgi:hypothetical protein